MRRFAKIYLPCSYSPRFTFLEQLSTLLVALNHPICTLECTKSAPQRLPRSKTENLWSKRTSILGEHLLCKHEPSFQAFRPLLSVSNIFNNFGESASRSK